MKSIFAIAKITLIQIIRDKVFYGLLFVAFLVACFSNIAADWSVAEFMEIYFQITASVVHAIGGLLAILWSAKIVHTAKEKGILDAQLSTAVSRSSWLVGSWLGVAGGLFLLWVLALSVIQGTGLFYNFSWFSTDQWVCFGFYYLIWLFVGTTALLVSLLGGQMFSILVAVGLWVAGLITPWAQASLDRSSGDGLTLMVKVISSVWNIGQLNFANYIYRGITLDSQIILARFGYAFSLIGLMLVLSCLVFSVKEFRSV